MPQSLTTFGGRYILKEKLGEGGMGLLYHHLGDDEANREHSLQALLITRELGYRSGEAFALTNLGHASAGLGELAKATEFYEKALNIQHQLGQTNLALEPVAGLARVFLVQGDLDQALTHAEKILTHVTNHTLNGVEEPFQVYLSCYRVLRAAQDPRREEFLAGAHRQFQTQAAKISNDRLRRSFLENIAVHKEIVEEFRLRAANWPQ